MTLRSLVATDHQPLRTVLLTGASTGLGLAIAKRLLRNPNYRLVLTARESSIHRFSSEGIEESPNVIIRPLDVVKETQRKAVVGEISDRFGAIDVLINNAAIATRSVVEHICPDELHTQMSVNFSGPVAMMALALEGMRKQRSGQIINISSVGGQMAMPTMAAYSASKFALEAISESLWYEVRPWNIKVSLVAPGFIHSDSFQTTYYTRKGVISEANDQDPYTLHYRYMRPFIAKLMNWSRATPDRVAQIVERTMTQKNPSLRIPATPDARLFFMLRRLLPRRAYHALLFHSLPGIRKWGKAIKAQDKVPAGITNAPQLRSTSSSHI